MVTSDEDSTADPTRHLIASASGSEVEYVNFVVELAPCVDIWTRMKQEHTRDRNGFCAARICARGGTGIAFMVWPCGTRRLADWACDAYRRSAFRGNV